MNNFEVLLENTFTLEKIEDSINTHPEKMQFVFLRAIIEGWLSEDLSNDDFLNDMQVLLGERTVDITE